MIHDESVLSAASELARTLRPGDLDATLEQITAAAVQLIPDVTYASVTVRHGDGRLETVSATDSLVLAADQKQYELHEGPCYDAATDTAQVVSPDLAADPRFPAYGPVAVQAGIRAQAAFRLFDHNSTQGALNLYSTRLGAFERAADTAELFRHQAAVAISYAHEISNLREALETRTTIGKAMGIVMERYGLNDERAFAFLTRLSQHRNVKLRLVAEELAVEAARTAEAARAGERSEGA